MHLVTLPMASLPDKVRRPLRRFLNQWLLGRRLAYQRLTEGIQTQGILDELQQGLLPDAIVAATALQAAHRLRHPGGRYLDHCRKQLHGALPARLADESAFLAQVAAAEGGRQPALHPLPAIKLYTEAGRLWADIRLSMPGAELSWAQSVPLDVPKAWRAQLIQYFTPVVQDGRVMSRPCVAHLSWDGGKLAIDVWLPRVKQTAAETEPETHETGSRFWDVTLPKAAAAAALIVGPALPAVAADYTVKSGDTLSSIARQHVGLGATWQAVFQANRQTLRNPNRIYPGMVLHLPESTAAVPAGGLVVRPGDTLFRLAQRHLGNGAKWTQLWAANKDHLRSPHMIYAGMPLRLPGGTTAAPESAHAAHQPEAQAPQAHQPMGHAAHHKPAAKPADHAAHHAPAAKPADHAAAKPTVHKPAQATQRPAAKRPAVRPVTVKPPKLPTKPVTALQPTGPLMPAPEPATPLMPTTVEPANAMPLSSVEPANAMPLSPVEPANAMPSTPVEPANAAPVAPTEPAITPAPAATPENVQPAAPLEPASIQPWAPAEPATTQPAAPLEPASAQPWAPAEPASAQPAAPIEPAPPASPAAPTSSLETPSIPQAAAPTAADPINPQLSTPISSPIIHHVVSTAPAPAKPAATAAAKPAKPAIRPLPQAAKPPVKPNTMKTQAQKPTTTKPATRPATVAHLPAKPPVKPPVKPPTKPQAKPATNPHSETAINATQPAELLTPAPAPANASETMSWAAPAPEPVQPAANLDQPSGIPTGNAQLRPPSMARAFAAPFPTRLSLLYNPLLYSESLNSADLGVIGTDPDHPQFTQALGAEAGWRLADPVELAGNYVYNSYRLDREGGEAALRSEHHGRLMGYYVLPLNQNLEFGFGAGAMLSSYATTGAAPADGRSADLFDATYQRVMVQTEAKVGYQPMRDVPLTLTAAAGVMPWGTVMQTQQLLPTSLWGFSYSAGVRYSLMGMAVEARYLGQQVLGDKYSQGNDMFRVGLGYEFR
jgi:LysM repeat protein